MKRTAAKGEFRSNLHQGGTAEVVKISRREREAAMKSARAFGLNMAGVDILRSSGGPKVLEVNSSPGFEGIEKASGKNIVGRIYDTIEKRVRPAAQSVKKSA